MLLLLPEAQCQPRVEHGSQRLSCRAALGGKAVGTQGDASTSTASRKILGFKNAEFCN